VRDVEVEFAVRDGAYIAYEIFGTGPTDLVVIPGAQFPIDHMWDLPQLAEFMQALGEIARVIAYDARGLGASDPMPTIDPAAGLESQASDLLAVMDAAESDRASILSFQPAAELVIAATYPQRVRSLILNNLRPAFTEMRGLTADERKSIARWIASPRGLKLYAPRLAHNPDLRRWWARAHRLVCSPEQLAREIEYASEFELGALLEQVHTPTLVFHRRGNQV
jgi:pimeloyl-ACP methyl ester carboxylesterase